MKVAEFRSRVDAGFRCANVDYHACVNIKERQRWVKSAELWIMEIREGFDLCPRVKADDVARAQDALRRLAERMARVAKEEAVALAAGPIPNWL